MLYIRFSLLFEIFEGSETSKHTRFLVGNELIDSHPAALFPGYIGMFTHECDPFVLLRTPSLTCELILHSRLSQL